jgi:hypothetical protein
VGGNRSSLAKSADAHRLLESIAAANAGKLQAHGLIEAEE